MEHSTRASRRFRRPVGVLHLHLFGAAAAVLLANVACTAVNRVGLEEGSGGDAGGDAGDPTHWITAGAYGLSGDPTVEQLAIVTGTPYQPIAIHAVQDATFVHSLEPAKPGIPNLLVSAANGIVAAADQYTVWLFNPDGSVMRGIPHVASITAIALTADASVLISGDAVGTVRRFQVATGAEILPPLVEVVPDSPDNPNTDPIRAVTASPDAAVFAVSSTKAIRLWSADGGAPVFSLDGTGSEIAISAAGELAAATETAVTFYSLGGTDEGQYPVIGPSIQIAYSGDGTRLAVSTTLPGAPDGPILVKIIERPSGIETASLYDDQQIVAAPPTPGTSVIGLAFMEQDSAVLVGWSDREVTLFGAADGVKIWSYGLGP